MAKTKLFNGTEVKDFAEATGEVQFYYSIFDNIDLVGDTVLKTAFKKTVDENKNNIFHDRDHQEAVGKPLEFGQDSKGAWCISQLAIKTISGNDTFEQYKAGLIKGHSMEYQPVKWSYDEQNDIRSLTEVRLWGVTSVTSIPANLDALTISIKSFEDIDLEMLNIERFLKSANISDSCGNKFLARYNELKKLVMPLEQRLTAVASTVITPEPTNLLTVSEIIKSLI